ncbi:MAG: DUF3800 domain-containing protein [Planctomycetes bacterium]|nr:DUF3800 domain-containing protein [Planctomycetota bacterium]
MYFFYIDESGSRDHTTIGTRADGSKFDKDHIFVLCAVSLLEHKWNRFETAINNVKREIIDDVQSATGKRFTIADVDIHSNLVRQPSRRNQHPFFQWVTREQMTRLTDAFYTQLLQNYMRLFAIVIDKRKLADFFDQEKMARKAYELLLERIQNFLAEFHQSHKGVIVSDDCGKQMNRSLALKHNYFQLQGTSSGVRLTNIVEKPFFVRDELSNGAQLADLCAYNVYRVFRYPSADYSYFERILPRFYRSLQTRPEKLDGLKVFPDDSDLLELAKVIGQKTARP